MVSGLRHRYDHVDPRDSAIPRNRRMRGSGRQINGTTGYEEAAAQDWWLG